MVAIRPTDRTTEVGDVVIVVNQTEFGKTYVKECVQKLKLSYAGKSH